MPKKNKNITVVVAMSGGVDSSVAAALLVEEGYNVIGITMKTYSFDEVGGNIGNESSCCGLDAFNDARMVAVKLGIPHYVADFTKAFEKEVIDNFVGEYLGGRTPNPCIICNRKIKWGELLMKADSLGAEFIATGHYARVRHDSARNRYQILRSLAAEKDQSYALWGLSQEALRRTKFPLGEMKKTRVREVAASHGLKTAFKEESFEICFVADNNYRRFLSERVPDMASRISEGDIVFDGKVVGRHRGYPYYTIGQRSGIGAHKERVYVTAIDPVTGTISIGRTGDLLHKGLIAKGVNLVSTDRIEGDMRVSAMVRYKDIAAPATASLDPNGDLHILFDEPKRAITPGQSVVVYSGEELMCGGIIETVLK